MSLSVRRKVLVVLAVVMVLPLGVVAASRNARVEVGSLRACVGLGKAGFRAIAEDRRDRFLGKVQAYTARCRGGERGDAYRPTPWVDWTNYWGTGDRTSLSGPGLLGHLARNGRGIDGALLDLEYQRMELIKFNLFDNYTFEEYVDGRGGVPGRSLKVWPQMRLPADDAHYAEVGGAGEQLCGGELIRYRNESGICNDIRNPLMGSTGTLFARNVQFEETSPELGATQLVRNRHGDRLGLLKPDPQVISRELFTRQQSHPERCRDGLAAGADARCDYIEAPFFNVLAAFWIQFMTHDWFAHLDEGRNSPELAPVGCSTRLEGGAERTLTAEEIAALGCRPGDRMDAALMADTTPPPTFEHDGRTHLRRAQRTTRNLNTAWWDASQLYGYSDRSVHRVKRDPRDPAKLLTVQVGGRAGAGERQGYLSVFEPGDPILPVLGRAGSGSVSGQLVHRAELLPQRLRARAQQLRGRVPQARGRGSGR